MADWEIGSLKLLIFWDLSPHRSLHCLPPPMVPSPTPNFLIFYCVITYTSIPTKIENHSTPHFPFSSSPPPPQHLSFPPCVFLFSVSPYQHSGSSSSWFFVAEPGLAHCNRKIKKTRDKKEVEEHKGFVGLSSQRHREKAVGMKIQCDVCERAPAMVICCADEAALCAKCDVEVHGANMLASKHQRLLLHFLSNCKLPRCDICQVNSHNRCLHFCFRRLSIHSTVSPLNIYYQQYINILVSSGLRCGVLLMT